MTKEYRVVDKEELKEILTLYMDDIKLHLVDYHNDDRYTETFRYLDQFHGIIADDKTKNSVWWLLFCNGIFCESASKFILFFLCNLVASLTATVILYFYNDLGTLTLYDKSQPEAKLVINYTRLMYRDVHTLVLVVILYFNPFDKHNFFKVKKGK